jgi:hypothetical protein
MLKFFDPGSGMEKIGIRDKDSGSVTLVTAFRHRPLSQLISVHTFNDDIVIYSTPLSLSFVPRNEKLNNLSSLF